HAASVRPEPGSNSPNKTSKRQSGKSDHNQKHLAKNNHTPKREKEAWHNKKQQTKTTKHTIEFSNNTPAEQATPILYCIVSRKSTRFLPGLSAGGLRYVR
ncbi:hypothetical protein, partial [Mycobacterium sp. IS-1742]|uniref:hypothetical protein n=1 Tax=Mycobacterium sp. IS-1742 TaxID=1772285 RepID=UPI001E64D537